MSQLPATSVTTHLPAHLTALVDHYVATSLDEAPPLLSAGSRQRQPGQPAMALNNEFRLNLVYNPDFTGML